MTAEGHMESPIRRDAAAAAVAWTLAVLLAGLLAPESLLAASRTAPASAPTVPLVFEENRGQADSHVMFLARGAAYSLYIAPTEAALVDRRTGQVVRIRLLGARPDVEVTALEPLPGRIHYIRGRNPAGWQTDVPTYGRVAYREVYPGIDAFYKPASGATFEQESLVRPDADPAAIRLAFDGAQRVVVDKTGDLVLATEKAPVRLGRPIAYQDIDGVRRAVSVAWSTRGPGEAGFRLGPYDRSRPLVIDPVITWATYLGDNGPEGRHQAAFGVAVDSAGNSYVTGDAILPSHIDVFVTKLNSTGQKLMYSVFIGGSEVNGGRAITVDADGNAYVAGFTTSADFPITPDALQTRHSGGSFDFPLDAFVLKLGPAGIPIYSTYLGGRDDDVALGIGVDAVGRAYVTGGTRSTDFPVANALQPRLAGVVEDQCEPRHLGGSSATKMVAAPSSSLGLALVMRSSPG
jgi:beta-propeller repeat-containing protein